MVIIIKVVSAFLELLKIVLMDYHMILQQINVFANLQKFGYSENALLYQNVLLIHFGMEMLVNVNGDT